MHAVNSGLILGTFLLTSHVMAFESSDSFQTTIRKEVGANYLVVKPQDYDEGEKYPLLIFLHGRGEQGEDLDRVKIHGPFKKVAELGLPVIIVAPQSPQDEWWDVDMLEAFTEHVIDEFNVDKDRVYLTGLSMGGSGTWQLATRRPDLFAAIAPICGWSQPSKAERIKELPVWVFHGAKDTVVGPHESTNMVDALYKVDNDARLTIYPEAGHDSWSQTYDNPDFYGWLLSHRRGSDGDWPSDRRRRNRRVGE